MQMIGGPLDGHILTDEINEEKPFVVFQVGENLASCYMLSNGKLYYINSKTMEELKEIKLSTMDN